jgi:hypothetical protein
VLVVVDSEELLARAAIKGLYVDLVKLACALVTEADVRSLHPSTTFLAVEMFTHVRHELFRPKSLQRGLEQENLAQRSQKVHPVVIVAAIGATVAAAIVAGCPGHPEE